jgi:SecD/SecF fusion protein
VTDRRRNLVVIVAVLGLLTAAVLMIIPGAPLSKETRLGLDLRGGVELVYQGRPTPKVPEVTPQAIDDAIETIRERTDSLGVSEPEIQRAGSDQISVGLPDVENAERAIEQVGTTAQLQFYDWEPNVVDPETSEVLGPDRAVTPEGFDLTGRPVVGSTALYEATKAAAKTEPVAEETDIPPGGPNEEQLREAGVNPADEQAVQRFYDRQNDSSTERFYLFAQNRQPIYEAGAPATSQRSREQVYTPTGSCEELLTEYADRAPPEGQRGEPRKYAEGTACEEELRALGGAGPPPGSEIVRVPQGVVVVEAERAPTAPDNAPRSYFILEDDSELDGSDIENPEQNTDPQTNLPVVTMEFTDEGRDAFATVTRRIAERGTLVVPPPPDIEQAFQRFAITLDNRIISLATINFRTDPEGIDGRTGAQITNIGNLQETQDLANQLRIGSLPIELKLISQTQVSATLGQQALDQGLAAGAAGLILVMLFLIVFYRVLGAIAGVALITYALLLFALVKLIPITLTLPGIAGLILTLGVAADANIVIFERIKEEARAGRSIAAAISQGYAKALRTIIDANVVTIGVAFILFMLATAGVKGFAFTLGVGTLVSLFTAVLATSAVLGSMSRTRLLGSRAALGAAKPRSHFRIDFMGLSRWFFSMSGAILVAGALAIAGLGLNFGIDFESGTRIKTPLAQPADVDDVRDALPSDLQDAKVQDLEEPELGENVVQISTATLSEQRVTQVREALDAEFGVQRSDFTVQSIGPTFGEQIARTALIAVIASLLLISVYIGLRFEFKYAVPVLIALAHDILITSGVYALTEREVTTSTVAALLTILGYSLYDTIIVFDRIRENVPRMPRATFSQIVNRSMSEVVVRSLATSVCVLMPISALLFFGGATLKDFAFALLVGVASGAYSSIFIAGPVLWHWKEREPVYRRRRQLVMEDHGGVVPAFAEGFLGEEEDGAAARRAAAPSPRARRAAARTDRQRAASAAATIEEEAPTVEEATPAAAEEEQAPEAEESRAAEQPAPAEPDGAKPKPSSVSSTGPKAKRSTSNRRRRHGRR